MVLDIVVDLQFGSTGKGAAVAYLTSKRKYDAAVRVQSIQAGHTIFYKGKPYKMRTIPCAWVNPFVYLVLGAGCFIDKELLLQETATISNAIGVSQKFRIYIDYRATYVLPEDVKTELDMKLQGKMGSTAHGAGASLIRKLWRNSLPTRVCDDTWAKDNGFQIVDTIEMLQDFENVIIEGCQGTMLSIHTSPYYPFVTAREATAAGILSETGLSPLAVRDIIGVFRTFPIRVGGNSGPTSDKELSWEDINKICCRNVEPERTTVTNRVRRIFEFGYTDFHQAINSNWPTKLFMTFADYLGEGIYGKSLDEMSESSRKIVMDFINNLREEYHRPINWISTSENPNNIYEIEP